MKNPRSKSGEITRLAQGKRDPTRVNVYLDNRFAFSLSAEEVITRGLRTGQTLSVDDVAELTSQSAGEKLFAKIVNFISYRPRSRREIEDRLYQYLGSSEAEAKSEVLSKLERLGYINDLDFARWFAQSRVVNRPRSSRHLAAELFSKGIDKETINTVLVEFSDDRAAIRALIAKKKYLEKDKLIAFLARRGFAWEMIRSEVDKQGVKE